jgi:mono/diheme cytochrome c family protein
VARKKKPAVSPTLQWIALGALVVAIAAAWIWFAQLRSESSSVSVTMPELSRSAKKGQEDFKANCAACHGERGGGTDQGPPLIHKIYEPGHHSDGAFFLAVQRGVRQHHWSFGNMPPQPQVTGREAALILEFIREVQVANGIY